MLKVTCNKNVHYFNLFRFQLMTPFWYLMPTFQDPNSRWIKSKSKILTYFLFPWNILLNWEMHQNQLHIDWFLSVSLSFSASTVFYRSEETTGSGLESHSQLLPAAGGRNQHWSVVREQTQLKYRHSLAYLHSLSLCLSVLTFSTLQFLSLSLSAYGYGCLSEGRTYWKSACGPKYANP